MRINEWSVTDARDVTKALREVNLRIPLCSGNPCWERHDSGLTCTRVKGHTGRHAATGTHGIVMAVWS